MPSSTSLLDVLDAWELLADSVDISKYSLQDIKTIARALRIAHGDQPSTALDSCHMGLHDSILVSEGNASCSQLALPLVSYHTVWVPDPLTSFLDPDAFNLWSLLPEGRGEFFDQAGGFRSNWRGLWQLPKEGRRNALRATLPRLLMRIRELRPLIECGAVRLFPWERTALADVDLLRSTMREVDENPLAAEVTRKFRSDAYAMGPRSGAFGITVNRDFGGAKAGDQLHLLDRRPFLLTALLNLEVSRATGSAFQASREGDRYLADFIESEGRIPVRVCVGTLVDIPDLSRAAWAELVSIRRDSEALELLRGVVRDAQNFAGTADALRAAVVERLTDTANKLRQDGSIKRAVRDSTASLTVESLVAGAVSGGTALVAAGAGPAGIAAGAATAAVATGLRSFVRRLMDAGRRRTVERSGLFLRLSERMDSE